MRYIVEGGNPIAGEVEIYSAKNAILPIIAAAVAKGGVSIIEECPKFMDVVWATEIVRYLGCECYYVGNDLFIDSTEIKKWQIPHRLARKFRGSIIFLSSLLVRFGKAEIGLPGGCVIGDRPINLHRCGFETLGTKVEIEGEVLRCSLENPIDNDVYLSFPSVGATQNLLIYITYKGMKSKIFNAAKEPEIDDLMCFLNSGSERYKVMPDRIVAATYLIAAAMTKGDITLRNINVANLESILSILVQMGCVIKIGVDKVNLVAPERLKSPGYIKTATYPGFPTDMQSMILAACTIAEGTTVIKENIFERRYAHCDELKKMGADIKTDGKMAVIHGVDRLKSANAYGGDLRGTAALILAALTASGTSEISGISHLMRGYIDFADSLNKTGCNIFVTEN